MNSRDSIGSSKRRIFRRRSSKGFNQRIAQRPTMTLTEQEINSQVVAVIPARSGSKRIPNKNFRVYENRTMVEHTISLAQETGLFDEIIVSLDNHEYDANFSEKDVILHYRPSELGSDDASTIQVVKDVLKSISGSRLSKVCCIYPCTPLLNSRRIAEGFALLERFPDRFVFASQPLYSNPSRAFTVDNEGLNFMDAKSIGKKTQELRSYSMDAGQFYWGRFSTWMTSDSILNDKSIPLNLPKWETIDVDDEGDLQIALALRSMRKGTGL